jgi:hypothetical protein
VTEGRLARRSLLLGLVLAVACAQPPSDELALAESRVERARQVDANLYSPESIASAEAALQQAQEELRRRKNYRGALRAAARAVRDADDAFREASVARAIDQRRAERLVRETESLLEMASWRGGSAAEPELAALRHRAAEVTRLFEDGVLVEAIAAGEALKPELIELERRFRNAEPPRSSR